jgi:hypothetical protein
MKSLSARSMWSVNRVDQFLSTYKAPLRLAVSTASGFPLICSLWFKYENERILCATTRNAKVVECISADPRCGFELAPNEPPYFGVRGQGIATISSDDSIELLGDLVDRYLGNRSTKFARWLLGREEEEVTISIEIQWATAWDYQQRMSE